MQHVTPLRWRIHAATVTCAILQDTADSAPNGNSATVTNNLAATAAAIGNVNTYTASQTSVTVSLSSRQH